MHNERDSHVVDDEPSLPGVLPNADTFDRGSNRRAETNGSTPVIIRGGRGRSPPKKRSSSKRTPEAQRRRRRRRGVAAAAAAATVHICGGHTQTG